MASSDVATAPPVSVGSHHSEATEETLEKCRQVLEKAAAEATLSHSRENIEALQAMLPDMHTQPTKRRIREMASHLGVPKKKNGDTLRMPQLFANVQAAFFTCVLEQPGCASASGGGGHSAEEALPALDGRILEKVRKLGRHPRELKATTTEEDEEERKLARLIRDRWEDLRNETKSELSALKNCSYGHVAQIKAIQEQMRFSAKPEILMPTYLILKLRLELMSDTRYCASLENLKRLACPPGREPLAWWEKAGVVLRPTTPTWCQQGGKQAAMPVASIHYNLCVVLAADAAAFLAAAAEYQRIMNQAWEEIFGVTSDEIEEKYGFTVEVLAENTALLEDREICLLMGISPEVMRKKAKSFYTGERSSQAEAAALSMLPQELQPRYFVKLDDDLKSSLASHVMDECTSLGLKEIFSEILQFAKIVEAHQAFAQWKWS